MPTKVYAPASIGNMSVGFDLLGAAISPISGELLGDCVSVEETAREDFQLVVTGRFASRLPPTDKDNIVLQAIEHFYDRLSEQRGTLPKLLIHLEKNLPVGSGLGSSASSIVAALHAVNEYFEKPFSDHELLLMMGEFEGQISGAVHYDNVAPCFNGGIQLMVETSRSVAQDLPIPEQWYWVCAYSGVKVSTSEARKVLPASYPLSTVVKASRNLSMFIDGLHRKDWPTAAAAIQDEIAEPHRVSLLPKFVETKTQLKHQGALSVGISGSGPTLFAVADSMELAEQLAQTLNDNYLQNEDGFCHICKIDSQGSRVI